MDLLVGRIGRPHGVKGAVTVEVHTDDPGTRFAAGSVLTTDPAEAGPLTVSASRQNNGILVITFAGVTDRNGAESLRGTRLLVDVDADPLADDPDAFYDHQLVGLTADHVDGTRLGAVTAVVHAPAAPVLTVTTEAGDEVLVPFVSAIVPAVDLDAGRLTIDPPDGMFGEFQDD